MNIYLFLLIFLMPLYGICGGTIVLNGTIHGFDSDLIKIEDGKKVYSIDRKKVESSQPKSFVNLKTGSKIELVVPFDALIDVNPKK